MGRNWLNSGLFEVQYFCFTILSAVNSSTVKKKDIFNTFYSDWASIWYYYN